MLRRPNLLVLVAAATIAAACAGGAGAGAAGGAATPSRGSGTRMEASEFRRAEFHTIYDAIKVLRPDWLQARGAVRTVGGGAEAAVVGVFIEGQARGWTLDKLQEYNVAAVQRVRRILASEAMASYGTEWAWGGIVVTLVR